MARPAPHPRVPRVPDQVACAAYYRMKFGHARKGDDEKVCCFYLYLAYRAAVSAVKNYDSPDEPMDSAQEATRRFLQRLRDGEYPF